MKLANKIINISKPFAHISTELLLATLLASILFLHFDNALPKYNREQIIASAQKKHLYNYLDNYITLQNATLAPEQRKHLLITILSKASRLEVSEKFRIQGRLINPTLFLTAIIQTESAFRPNATSSVGARGYMQLMPATYLWLNQKLKQKTSLHHITKTEVNIERGVVYFNYLLAKLDNIRMACLAYNAGPGNVQRGVWLEEYWQRIFNTYKKLQRHSQQKIIADNSDSKRSENVTF